LNPDGTIINYTWIYVYDGTPHELWEVNPSFDFLIGGNYEIILNVTDNDWRYDEDITWVNITNLAPIADAGPDQNTKRLVTFDGSGSDDSDGSIVNYTWMIVSYDGSPKTIYGISPSFDFNISGIYEVILWVKDYEGDDDFDTVNITIDISPPIADAGPDQNTKRLVTFDGSGSDDSDGSITNYTWTFTYDGFPIELWEVTPFFDFNISGVYEVMLKVTDDDWRYGYDNVTITIDIFPPIADAGPDQGTLKGTYWLNASGSDDPDGTIENYTWTFIYDGSPVEFWVVNFSFDFLLEGDYEITLNVTDDDWRYGEDMVWVNITFEAPIADAGPDQNTKRLVTFDGSLSDDTDGTVENYTWTFTYDGSPVELWEVNPSFDFNMTGMYEVMLTVTDNDGLMGYDNVTITIDVSPPIADAGIDQGTLKGTYWLDGSLSDDSDGSITNYTWTFTYDGSPVELWGVNPSFDFLLEGDYAITLNVTDDDWRYGEDIVWVNITFEAPTPILTWLPYDTNKGTKQIIGTNSIDIDGSIVNYTWTFEYDSVIYNRWTGVFFFDFIEGGFYDITLNITDDDGLQNEITQTVFIILIPPVADAGINKTAMMHQTILFDGSGSYDLDGIISNYTWIFDYSGTNYTLYGEMTEFRLNGTGGTGIYNLTLIVTDDSGQQDWSNITVDVFDAGSVMSNWILAMIPLVILFLILYYIKRKFEELGTDNKGGSIE